MFYPRRIGAFVATLWAGVCLSACIADSLTAGLTVNGNDDPVALDQRLELNLGETSSGSLQGTDADGDSLTYTILSQPRFGLVELTNATTGAFSVSHTATESMLDAFTFQVTDGTNVSNVGVVTLVILEEGQPAPEALVSGVLTYDSVPVVCGVSCLLDYDATTVRPIRGAIVQILDGDSDTVRATTVSADDGSYGVSLSQLGTIRVLALAQSDDPPVTVEDNTTSDSVYGLMSDVVDPLTTLSVSLHAASGWDGSAYTSIRSAGPFAIFDAMMSAFRLMTSARPNLSLSPLKVNWSVDNRPQSGSKSTGAITTSHWDGEELYILGASNVDTDEYDVHVIVHEWAHYFEAAVSRADSVGGQHGFADILDPRVAYSEGWGNAASAMVFHPDATYKDTFGSGQGDGFKFNVEDNLDDAVPGWFSESSVQIILYDLFDDVEDDGGWDTVSLGAGPILDVMTGPVRGTDALVTLFPFVRGLKQNLVTAGDTDTIAAVDALLARSQIAALSDAEETDFGLGATNDAGFSGNLPVYHSATIGGADVTLSMRGVGGRFNLLNTNRYVQFTGDGGSVDVTVTSTTDVDLFLYQQGNIAKDGAAVAENFCSLSSCVETILNVPTTSGATYVLSVVGFHSTGTEFSATVSVTATP